MKCLSAKGFQRGFGFAGKLIRLGLEAAAINLVAEERVADRREMDAYLVGASGFQAAGDEARHRRPITANVALEHLPMGDRRAAAGAHGHLLARAGMAADRLVDSAARPLRRAPHEGQVAATQRLSASSLGELAAERAVS